MFKNTFPPAKTARSSQASRSFFSRDFGFVQGTAIVNCNTAKTKDNRI